MDYESAIEYLYNATPQFQQIGAAAYKPGLATVEQLSRINGNSHCRYPIIHVAGTNGKGSTSHTIASILQSAGYKVGLFTSPHLVDFRERIRVNGEVIPQHEVTRWLEEYIARDTGLEPSFFELTTVMAFDYFAMQQVDVAVIEVGLGGRLDSTNIVTPVLSIITNISKDHVAQLGDSLSSIAREKAGIIKPGTPALLGESCTPEVKEIFTAKASECGAKLTIADEEVLFDEAREIDCNGLQLMSYTNTPFGDITAELTGAFQIPNANTVLHAMLLLRNQGFKVSSEAVAEGFRHVNRNTGLTGRWTIVDTQPLTVCDTGHNEGAWKYLGAKLAGHHGDVRMVIGFVNDKDIDSILTLLPRNASYYFTRASVPRALPALELKLKAAQSGIDGECFENVSEALSAAKENATQQTLIFIGGSNFIVADYLALQRNHDKPAPSSL